jgi:CxxC motif-containing protein (DUF1111 family)
MRTRRKLLLAVLVVASFGAAGVIQAQNATLFRAHDPGLRGGGPGAGDPFTTLTADELEMFNAGKAEFAEEEEVADGLGPRFNFVSCAGCHAQPTVGGTSPAVNPLFRVNDPGDLRFTGNVMPSFITPNGPVREARFPFNADGSRDGGVHALFVITGHPDAAGCFIRQEDFERQVRNRNIIFRIPTPVFGAGLIEQVPDGVILANLGSLSSIKSALGISGRVNRSGNDGTITRFGWKAQNKSLAIFSGEAYNVEMGITSELFQQERDETANCQFATEPNDLTPSVRQLGNVDSFANFQRFLAPPTPSTNTPGGPTSIDSGRQLFVSVGCGLCHSPTLKTRATSVAALSDQTVRMFSDLALHQMGPGLADDILQGGARGDEFRTAPLWGLGQRIFFLHDGRTTDLLEAIQAHRSAGSTRFPASEANAVIDRFNQQGEAAKQDLLNFLRSL